MISSEVPQNGARHNVAVIGASSLKGKEVKELLEDHHFPSERVILLDAEEVGGQLTEFGDEPAIILPISKESFEDASIAIFASSPAFTKAHWQFAVENGCEIVDMSYYLESQAGVQISAPVLESGNPAPGAPPGIGILVPAHPVAIGVAGILRALSCKSQVTRSVVTVYEPASEHGQAGVDELHQQTINLLSFQKLPRQVFDSQVAFNLLSTYGEASKPALREVQERIALHVRALLPSGTRPPALQVIQAPVFYGYSFSCYVEFQQVITREAIQDLLNSKPFSVKLEPDAQPTVITAVGSEEVQIGRVEEDISIAGGYWIWGVLDNVRLAAFNAVQIAERLLYARVTGGSARQ